MLNVSKDSLLSFTQELFGAKIIDRNTKISVNSKGGKQGADALLDLIGTKVKMYPNYLQEVLELMEKNENLCPIVKKIKDEYEGEEIVISLIWIRYNYLYM